MVEQLQRLGTGILFTEVEKKLIVVRCWEDYLPRQKRELLQEQEGKENELV